MSHYQFIKNSLIYSLGFVVHVQAGRMAQLVTVNEKPDNLSLILGTHILEKRFPFQKLPSSDLHLCTHTHTHTTTTNDNNKTTTKPKEPQLNQTNKIEKPARVIGALFLHLPFFIFILEPMYIPERARRQGCQVQGQGFGRSPYLWPGPLRLPGEYSGPSLPDSGLSEPSTSAGSRLSHTLRDSPAPV